MSHIMIPCPHEEPKGAQACALCRAAVLAEHDGYYPIHHGPVSRGTPMPSWFKDTVRAVLDQQASSNDEPLPIEWEDQ